MTEKFEFKNIAKLESPERRKRLPARKILLKIGLKKDHEFADIGAGTGYFSMPASKIVGKKGKVYAVDTSEEMIGYLKKRSQKISNITTINSSEYNNQVNDKVDFVFMSHVFHEITDKRRILMSLKRILRKDGKIVIIDWEKKEMKIGPPMNHRLSKEDVKKELKNAGFKDIKETKINDFDYCITSKF